MTATATDVKRMKAIAVELTKQHITPVFFTNWDTMGVNLPFDPWGEVLHWDASSLLAGEWGSLATIRAGDPSRSIPGPLAQTQIPRCLDRKPKVGITAAGRANHAGKGGPYRLGDGRFLSLDNANAHMIGTESAWAGPGETPNQWFWESYYGLAYAVRVVLG